MSRYRLSRSHPTKLEITVTSSQIVSMFPVEQQEHPVMGIIQRVWKTPEKTISVDTVPSQYIIDLSGSRQHLKVDDNFLLSLLPQMDSFQIILYYEGKEDIYQVEPLKD
ncbi:hypothetical protein [Persephonella sp.]